MAAVAVPQEMYLQLTIVRHGETAANKAHVLQGQLDTELSGVGRAQSLCTGRRLATAETISHIYSSDLSRAVKTAELIRQELGYSVGLSLDSRLRERGYGELEGQPVAELVRVAREAGVGTREFTVRGGERLQDVADRMTSFLAELFRDFCEMDLTESICRKENGFLLPTLPSPHYHVLLVGHGGSLHILCEQLRLAYGCSFPHRNTPTPNAAISSFLLSLRDNSTCSAFTLTTHNTDHLR